MPTFVHLEWCFVQEKGIYLYLYLPSIKMSDIGQSECISFVSRKSYLVDGEMVGEF